MRGARLSWLFAIAICVGCGGAERPAPHVAAPEARPAGPEPPPASPRADPERVDPSSPVEPVATVAPVVAPYDASAFAQVCLWSRATLEAGNEWRLFGCPPSPALLPPSSRPRAIVRRLAEYTPQIRAEPELDASGRLVAIEHTLERLGRRRVVYEWASGELTTAVPAEGGDRSLATVYRRDGERWVGEQPGLRRTFVPATTGRGSFEQVVENSSGASATRWSLAFDGRSHVATCLEGCGHGYQRVELVFDEQGRPIEARSSLSPAIEPDLHVFIWRDQRLVGVDAMTGEMTERRRVMDVLW